jgi:hypothetical protein
MFCLIFMSEVSLRQICIINLFGGDFLMFIIYEFILIKL